MSGTRRTLLLVGGLLIALTVLLVPRFLDDTQTESTPPPSNPAGSAAKPAPGADDVTDVKLELLESDERAVAAPERNPFRFEAKAPPPPPASARRDPPRGATPPPPLVPAGPPPPPPIPLRFVGVVAARGGGRAAAFSDGRGNNFLAREGDIIEGRYKVLRLGPDSVELAYLDGRGRQTIRLSGQ